MRPRYAIVLAAAIVYAVGRYVPFGDYALYPLTLFTTWVHEMGHGMTALALGGRFDSLEIFGNAAGLAQAYAAPGWRDALVALGGLLAPPIVGAAILAFVHGPKRARVVLVVLAAALALSLVLYVRSTAGVIAMPIVAAGLLYAAWWAPSHRVIVAQVLGVVLALDTLTRMVGYVFEDSVEVDGKKQWSDIHNVASQLGGHYVVWGMAVTAVAVGLLALGLWWAWRRPEPGAATIRASVRRELAS
ncbi:MAG TPA: M50 family metallopeptidase [Kofleriaceae bacterium]|nr:M50 family metallopeptidase [Kofleriaceae bacterium]